MAVRGEPWRDIHGVRALPVRGRAAPIAARVIDLVRNHPWRGLRQGAPPKSRTTRGSRQVITHRKNQAVAGRRRVVYDPVAFMALVLVHVRKRVSVNPEPAGRRWAPAGLPGTRRGMFGGGRDR